ncbi:hypothetical protein [Nonomuraea sp. NPDC049625]|uniref:hypothetical protein n=2 Tax=unclassified Nonomuraea TaxID=2593643 RepID=UPI0034404D38
MLVPTFGLALAVGFGFTPVVGCGLTPAAGWDPASAAGRDPASAAGWDPAFAAGPDLASAAGCDAVPVAGGGVVPVVGSCFVPGVSSGLAPGVRPGFAPGVEGPEPGPGAPLLAGADMPASPSAGVCDTTTASPRSGSLSAARTSPTDMNPAIAAAKAKRTNVPRCFMTLTLTPFEETTLKPR